MRTYRLRTPLQLVANIVGPFAAVLAAWLMSLGDDGGAGMTQANVALVMAVVTVLFALLDWMAGLTTSVAAALALNYYHTEPFHTLRVTDSRDTLSIGLLLTLGLTVSAATAFRVRRDVHHIRQADIGAAAEELRAMRAALLSQHLFKTYSGYVLSQFRRMAAAVRAGNDFKPKHAMHLVRLLHSGIHALQTGEILVDVSSRRDELLRIKRGELSFDEVKQQALALEREFQAAFEKTALPEQPDFARVNRFSNLEGRTLFDVLEPQVVPRLRARMAEYGIAESAVAGLRPWRVYYLVNGAYRRAHPPADEQKPVDAALVTLAREAGKPASYEFAGFADLAEFMGSMPDKAQSQYVEWLLDYLDERERGGSDSYGWIEGRRPTGPLERMAALPELFAEMQDKRNRWWAATIRDRLAAGRSAFVGVGQLHVMGPAGIPAQLAALGLEAVPAS